MATTEDTPAADTAAREITDRVERTVSYGRPTCDVCYDLSPDERPTRGEFTPRRPVHYFRAGEGQAYRFWAATLCEHHDTPGHRPEGATHRAVDEPTWVGDEHHMKTAHSHTILTLEAVE